MRSFYRPDMYWALVIFLVPWQTRWIFASAPTEYATLSLYALDVLMIIALVLSKPWQWWQTSKVQPRGSTLDSGSLVSILILGGLTILIVSNPILAVYKIVLVVLIGASTWSIYQQRTSRILHLAFIASVFLQSILGLLEFVFQYVPGSALLGMASQDPMVLGTSVVAVGGVRWLRAYGSFPHPNMYGAFLAFGLIFITDWLTTALRENNRRASWLALLIFIITCLGLAVSTSRAAVLGVIFGLMVFFGRCYQLDAQLAKKVLLRVGAAVIIVLGTITMVLPDVWATRLRGDSRLEEQSIQDRTTAYAQSWQIFKEHPLFGTGLGNYTTTLEKMSPGRPSYWYQPVHNAYVLLFVELGLVGSLLLAYMLRRQVVSAWPLLRASRPILSAVIVAVFVLASVDHYLWSLHSGLLFWLLISYLVFSGSAISQIGPGLERPSEPSESIGQSRGAYDQRKSGSLDG